MRVLPRRGAAHARSSFRRWLGSGHEVRAGRCVRLPRDGLARPPGPRGARGRPPGAGRGAVRRASRPGTRTPARSTAVTAWSRPTWSPACPGTSLAHCPWTRVLQAHLPRQPGGDDPHPGQAVAASDRKPAFLAQNGIAGYGDRGDAVADRGAPGRRGHVHGSASPASWQAATEPAAEAGARVVVMRTGVVLDRRGGAAQADGAPVQGRARRSGSAAATSTSPRSRWSTGCAPRPGWPPTTRAAGAYNLTGPDAGHQRGVHREPWPGCCTGPPSCPCRPSPIRLALRDVASELLGSTRVEPERLLEEGFAFEHTDPRGTTGLGARGLAGQLAHRRDAPGARHPDESDDPGAGLVARQQRAAQTHRRRPRAPTGR